MGGIRNNFQLPYWLPVGADLYRSLLSPAEVLTTNPVILNDYRKLLIDIPGVNNAWLQPVEAPEPRIYYDPTDESLYLEPAAQRELLPVRGIYRVLIESDRSRLDADLLNAVSRRLHAHRNLGEDFEFPMILPRQPIRIQAKLEVAEIDNPSAFLAGIYHELATFISPSIRFYTLSEMLDRGWPADRIWEGPILAHGFIDDDELTRFDRPTALRASDLIRILIDIPGVEALADLTLVSDRQAEDWYLPLALDRTPYLDVDASLVNHDIQLTRGQVAVQPNAAAVVSRLEAMRQTHLPAPLSNSQREFRLTAGRDRRVGHYTSIRHQFPVAYGIGEAGLPASASAQRRGQAKQLQGYLMFFDQLLANYFTQLANVHNLFSFASPQPHTYFSQLIEADSPELNAIRSDTQAARLPFLTEHADRTPTASASPPDDDRQNRFLNHLLARFAETFTDFSLLH